MTRYLSDGTTDFTSNLSVRGRHYQHGVPSWTSVTQAVVALTVSAQSSIDTTFTMSGAAVGDAIIAVPPSALSGDLSFNAWASAANTITLRLSNVSGTNNAQTAQTWTFYRIDAI